MRPIFMFVITAALWALIAYVVWIVWQISAWAGVNGFWA